MSNRAGIDSFGDLKDQQSSTRNVVENLQDISVGDVGNIGSSHTSEEVQNESHSLLAAAHRVGEIDTGCVSNGSLAPEHDSLKNKYTGNTKLWSKFSSCIQANETNYLMLESKSIQAHDESLVLRAEPVDRTDKFDCSENALEKRDQCKGRKRTCETTDVENKVKHRKVGMDSNLPVDEDRSIMNKTRCQSLGEGNDSSLYNNKQYASKGREKHCRSKGAKRTYETTDIEKVAKRVESKLKTTGIELESQRTGRQYSIMKNLLNTSSNVVRSVKNERQYEKIEKGTKFVGKKDRSQIEEDRPKSSGIARSLCEVEKEYASVIVAEHRRRVEAVDTLLQLQETLGRSEPQNTVAVSESDDRPRCTLQQSDYRAADTNEMNQQLWCEMATNNECLECVDIGSERLMGNSVSAFSICNPGYKGNSSNQNIVPSLGISVQNMLTDPLKMVIPPGNYSKINQHLAYSLPNQPSRPTPIYMPASSSSQAVSTYNIPRIDAMPLNMVLAETGKSTKLICCDKCHAFFNSFMAVEAHNKSVHKYLTTCKVCYKGFKTTSNLERHNRIHQGKRDFKCFCCGREFSRKDHLTSHILTHPVKCPVCCQKFKERTSLASHCGVKHRLEVKFCNYCNEALPNNDEYEKHIRWHASSSTSSIRNEPSEKKLNDNSRETADTAPAGDSAESIYKSKKTCNGQGVNTTSREVEGKTQVTDTTAVGDSDDASSTQRTITTDDVCRSCNKSQSEMKQNGEREEQEWAFKDLSVVQRKDEAVDIVNRSDESKPLNKGYAMTSERHRDLKQNFSGMSGHQVRDDLRYTVSHNSLEKKGENLRKKKLKQKHPTMIFTKDVRASASTFSCVSKADDKPNCTKPEKSASMAEQVMRGSAVTSISNSRPVISVSGPVIENNHLTGLPRPNKKADELPVNKFDVAAGIMGLPSAFKIELGPQNSALYPSSSYCEPLQSARLYNMAHTAPYYSYCQGNHLNINQGKILMTNPVLGLDHGYENLSQGGRGQQARRCRLCNSVFPSDQLYAVHYLAYHCSCHLKA